MAEKTKTALAKLVAEVAMPNAMRSVVEPLELTPKGSHQKEEEIFVQDQKSNFKDNFFLKKEDNARNLQNSLNLQRIHPNKCHLWQFADRPDDELGDIEALAESIKKIGMQEPILVRPSKATGMYEIIFGNRRWRACQLIDEDVLAIVKDISDKDAALIQKEENSERQDISDYAKAKNYKRLIDAQVFKSELELSKYLNISPQNLNDLFSYLRIPKELVDGIPNFKFLSKRLAVKLASLSKKKDNLTALLQLADDIGHKKITSSNIEQKMLAKLQPSVKKELHTDFSETIITDRSGKKAIMLKTSATGSVTIKISKDCANKVTQKKLIDQLKQLYNLEF